MADYDKLVVALEARITDFERNLKRANSTATKQFKAIEKSAETMTGRLGAINAIGSKAFTGLGAVALGALAPILSVAAALGKARKSIEDFSNISDSAKATGLDAEFFQILAHQAALAGVEVDKMSGALEGFSKNAGLAAVGKGKMLKGLQALNPELLQNILLAETQEERVRLAADAINDAGSASQKAALSATLFGDAGSRMVEVFSGGSAAIDATAKSARDLGIIVDRELIARTEELGDQLDVATKILDVEFSKALVDLAPLMVSAAQLAGNYAAAIGGIVDSFRDLENQSTKALNSQLAELGMKRLDNENAILELQAKQREELAAMSQTAKDLGFADSKNPQLFTGQIDELKKRSAELASEEQRILSILDSRKPVEVSKPKADTSEVPEAAIEDKSRKKAAEDALREAEAVSNLISELRTERAEIGMSDTARAQSAALREAGSAATADQRAEIISLVSAIESERTALEAGRDAAAEFRNEARGFAGDLVNGLRNGAKASDVLRDALSKVVDKMAEASLDTLFGTGKSAGGGATALVGGAHLLNLKGEI